jgi:hypothetical protein
MEEQIPRLEAFFKRCETPREEEDGDDIDNDGEYWEFQNPEKVAEWSLRMIPFKNLICFSYKYIESEAFYFVSFDEKIKDIAHDKGSMIKIHCVTAQTGIPEEQQCHFTIVLDSAKISLNITPFIMTLEPTEYRSEIPEMEKKIDNNFFHNAAGKLFTRKTLCNRLRTLFVTFEVFKA